MMFHIKCLQISEGILNKLYRGPELMLIYRPFSISLKVFFFKCIYIINTILFSSFSSFSS